MTTRDLQISMKHQGLCLIAAGFAIGLSACVPKVYVIDRQTVLEAQAAGQWPKFEQDVIDSAKSKGPVALPEVPVSERRARLYNVLNGEMGL